MHLTKFAQSCCLITTKGGRRILIDPGSYNAFGQDFPTQFPSIHAVIVTHEHADHCSQEHLLALQAAHFDVEPITNPSLATTLRDFRRITTLEPDEMYQLGDCVIRATPTDHMGLPNFGVLIENAGVRMYHAGDTRYIFPEKVGVAKNPDLLLIPISNRGLVMGVDDAAYFAAQLHPKLTVPIHYDGPRDKDRVNPELFVTLLGRYGLQGKILAHGVEIDLRGLA